MSAKRRNGFELSKHKYHARFETLESRRCLSASLPKVLPAVKPAATPPPATISTPGHSLVIKDTEAGDTIAVTDDGVGDVSVLITYSTGGTLTDSVTGIRNVDIYATGGSDIIDYTYGPSITLSASPSAKSAVKPALSTSTTSNESIYITVGKGGNTVDFTDSAGLTSANLSLDVEAGGGHNTVTETFGALASAKLFSTFDGYGGNDTFSATVTGDLTASQAFFSAYGGGGTNNLGVSVTGDIDAESLLNAQLDGGFKGSDTINFFYSGMLDGKLFANTSGTGGNETITQTITANEGSTGSVHSDITAGKGSAPNMLGLTLTDDSNGGSDTATSTLKSVNAVILDQPGDTPTLTVSTNDTADVSVITQRAHGWFWGWLGFIWGW